MITFHEMVPEDWERVRQIYADGIKSGHATFQQQVPEWDEWNTNHLGECRVVAKVADRVAGWAALSPVSKRMVYEGVAEVSVYVDTHFRSQKIGGELLRQLVIRSEENKIWTLQSSIFRENKASIHIHETNGFRIVGVREKIGKMNGIWRDTLLLERRSKKIGYD